MLFSVARLIMAHRFPLIYVDVFDRAKMSSRHFLLCDEPFF